MKPIKEVTVDLTKLTPFTFDLEVDENGYVPFTLPTTEDKIKFKFLSRQEERERCPHNSLPFFLLTHLNARDETSLRHTSSAIK